jgi:hypothetical protein
MLLPWPLRLICRIEGNDIGQFGGAARKARPVFDMALGDLASMQQRVADVRGKVLTAHSMPQRGNNIGAADNVELRSF